MSRVVDEILSHRITTMTEDVFQKVMAEVKKHKRMFDDSVHYYPKKFSVSTEEFMDVFSYLDTATENVSFYNENIPFYNKTAYIKYGDDFYTWELVHGQGSSCGIMLIDSREQKIRSKR